MPKLVTSVELVKEVSEFVESPEISEFRKLPSGKIIGGPIKYKGIEPKIMANAESYKLFRSFKCYNGDPFGDYVSHLTHPQFSRLVQLISERSHLPLSISTLDTSYEAINLGKETREFSLSNWILNDNIFTRNGRYVENPTIKEINNGGLVFDVEKIEKARKVDIDTEDALETLVRSDSLSLSKNQETHKGKVVFDEFGFSSVMSRLVTNIFCLYANGSLFPHDAIALYELPKDYNLA